MRGIFPLAKVIYIFLGETYRIMGAYFWLLFVVIHWIIRPKVSELSWLDGDRKHLHLIMEPFVNWILP